MTERKRKRGERGWSEEQKKQRSEYMKAAHQSVKTESKEKDSISPDVPFGELIERLKVVGASDAAILVFKRSCETNAKVVVTRTINDNGELVEVAIVQ